MTSSRTPISGNSEPDEIYSVEVIDSDQRKDARFLLWGESPANEDEVLLVLEFGDRRVEASTEEGFFDAQCAIRRDLEKEGLLINCYGGSRTVFPSPMSRSMGYGEKAYLLKMGQQAKASNLVSIFESSPDVEPATLEQQQAYYNEWLQSLR